MSIVAELLSKELVRQRSTLTLIASENYPSQAVLTAAGSVLSAKYSEGYPGARYYGGNQVVDEIENLAIAKAREVFGAEHANVQPYSGSPANLAALLALTEPGSTIMGLALPSGGHLTHGFKVSITGKIFRSVQYGVSDAGLLDFDAIRQLAITEKPAVIICGATAYSRIIDFAAFKKIADEVGAKLLADIAHISGLVATGLHPSPVPHADIVTMTTHKMLRGPRGALILSKQDYAKPVDKWVFPGLQGGPHNSTTAGIAQCLIEAQTDEFKKYCQQVLANARILAETLVSRGLTLVTGGTDNHLLLVDLRSQNISGFEVEQRLESVGIIANRNTVPNDPRPPREASGLRLGSPALTTRGLGKDEFKKLGEVIADIILNPGAASTQVASQLVEQLTRDFTLYA
jgi:glycine hydroxymethyltransferase